VAAVRRLWFPREFAAGSGQGTIETPSGELVEGKHQAAWPYALWQRMVEAKAGNFRRPQRAAQRQPREFSRLIVCAGCHRALRVQPHANAVYYRDTSAMRRLPCPAHGCLSVNSATVIRQFGELLASIDLPERWRAAIAERCAEAIAGPGSDGARSQRRRRELEAELQRFVEAFGKGYLAEEDLDRHIARIRSELATVPRLPMRGVAECTQAAITAGETLADMASYWLEAEPEERRDMAWSLLELEGLLYDLERGAIVGMRLRPDVLVVLALGLAPTWEAADATTLTLRQEACPPKRPRPNPHRPPLPARKLTPTQCAAARALVESGQSLRAVGQAFGVSRMAILRLMQAMDAGEVGYVTDVGGAVWMEAPPTLNAAEGGEA
jgi:hypothetical protein